jgi:ribosomal-protein-alanine N-acetyltransferase
MMLVRKMCTADALEASEIEKKYFSVPWSKEAFEDALARPENIYVVAEQDGHIAGYAGSWGVFGETEITNVCVDEEYRRRGIAGKLIDFLVEEAQSKGVEVFFLEVRQSNTAAIKLYESRGFKNIGVRKNFYERPREDGMVMSLTIIPTIQ